MCWGLGVCRVSGRCRSRGTHPVLGWAHIHSPPVIHPSHSLSDNRCVSCSSTSMNMMRAIHVSPALATAVSLRGARGSGGPVSMPAALLGPKSAEIRPARVARTGTRLSQRCTMSLPLCCGRCMTYAHGNLGLRKPGYPAALCEQQQPSAVPLGCTSASSRREGCSSRRGSPTARRILPSVPQSVTSSACCRPRRTP